MTTPIALSGIAAMLALAIDALADSAGASIRIGLATGGRVARARADADAGELVAFVVADVAGPMPPGAIVVAAPPVTVPDPDSPAADVEFCGPAWVGNPPG